MMPFAFTLPQIQIPARYRKILYYAGYPLFAVAVTLVTVFVSLPRDRIKDKVEATLSADPFSGQPGALGMDVSIGDLGLTLFSGAGLRVKDVVLRSRPLKESDKPARYTIDDLTVHVGLLGLMFNRPTYSFKVHGFQGEVVGAVSISPAEQRFRVDASGLVLTGVQSLSQAVGLPVEGTVSSVKLDAVAPKGLTANLEGVLDFEVDGLVIGDGKAKLTVPGDPFLSQGLTFPKLKLGKLSGHVVMEKGRARLEDVRVHSADGDATLEGYIELHDPIGSSIMHGYLKFRPSEALTKREPTVELMNNALAQAKRPDGFIGFQLSGPLTSVYYLPNANPPPGVLSKAGAPSLPSAPATAPTVQAPPPPPHALPQPFPTEPAEPPPPPPPPPSPVAEPPSPPPSPSLHEREHEHEPGAPVGPPSGVRPSLPHIDRPPAEEPANPPENLPSNQRGE